MRLLKTFSLAKIVAIFLFLFAVIGARAQESLLIGPGDLVHVVYFDAGELNQQSRVTDAGDFPLLMGGNIRIAGLTPEQAAAKIAAFMSSSHYLVNPRVVVTVDSYATQSVSVLGAVHLPGAYPIATGKTISEVLALAGGLLPDADRTVVVQRRVTGELLTFYNANSPLTTPDSSAPGVKRTGTTLLTREVMVYPGDTVRVAHAELVYVLGDVGRPGGFPIVNNDAPLTVLQLISLAGATNKTANPNSARLIRKLPDGKFEDIHLPLSSMQKGKQADRPLQAGDIIYVPFSYLKNALLGVGNIASAAGSATIYRY
ncbi:SLBB domain-containing protein [Granulicella aggregans]|jgi:polysaccharide export outer membrane protein|uniref:SLBB domain-containing protein n=1 Tax=Granulicella aggregans TaxID=474949 RepID=UPI0021E0EC3B|nr:SLBB domain-containing protein [Granulicella aggregans]